MINFTKSISITIPVFERYEFFEACLDSALNQSVCCEIIVVDNCSSHNKFEQYINSKNNKNIFYHRNSSNLGMIGNWNKCLNVATTDWVTILHDDDLLYANFIECFEKVRKLYPDCCCISSGCKIDSTPPDDIADVDANIKLQIRNFKVNEFNYSELSPFPGIAINKKTYNLRFIESIYPIADLDFWVRMAKAGTIIKFSATQAYYRLDQTQTSAVVISAIIAASYLYKKENLKTKRLLERIYLLTAVIKSASAAKKLYKTNVNPDNYITREDKFLFILLSNKLALYMALLLKFIFYRFGLYFKYKSIKGLIN